MKRSILLYSGVILFIGMWWTAAFQSDEKPCFTEAAHFRVDMGAFNSIDRDQLRDALIGDVDAMMHLIAAWDKEAKHNDGLRLTAEEYRHAHQLSLEYSHSKERFFPQTYASAAFMMAIASPDQIIALPKGLRRQTDLFPESLTAKIPLDTDRYTTELLSIDKPFAAFIAAYSDPNTLNALKQQKIPGLLLNDATTIDGIILALQDIGQATGNQQKAELLALFMKASFHALDNRTEWLKSTGQMPRFLLAIQIDTLKLPTRRTLSGQILARMGVETPAEMCWSIPLTKEHIQKTKPDRILIASDQTSDLPLHVQMFPTQHIVLAYFDILNALTS